MCGVRSEMMSRLKLVLAVFVALAVVFSVGASIAGGKKKKGPPAWQKRSEAALATLEQPFQKKVAAVLVRLRKKGWEPVVISGRRSIEQQRKIVAAGRSGTMKSRHLCGRAADVMDRRHVWKGPAANPNFKFWTDLGVAARAEGLEWGGDWKRVKDVPHIQSPLGCGQKGPAKKKPAKKKKAAPKKKPAPAKRSIKR